jgi:ribosomal protein L37E
MRLFTRKNTVLLSAAWIAAVVAVSCSKNDGDVKYDPQTQFRTEDGCVYDKCGGKDFDPKNQYCASDSNVYDMLGSAAAESAGNKCGDNAYDPESQFCHDGNVMEKCGGNTYNPQTHDCAWYGGEGRIYDRETEFAFVHLDSYGQDVYKKCGGKEYDLATQFCENDKIRDYKCGDKKYNVETQFCHRNTLYDKCVSLLSEPASRNEYNPDKQQCKKCVSAHSECMGWQVVDK